MLTSISLFGFPVLGVTSLAIVDQGEAEIANKACGEKIDAGVTVNPLLSIMEVDVVWINDLFPPNFNILGCGLGKPAHYEE